LALEAQQVNQLQKNLIALGVLVTAAAGLGLYAYFGVMKTEERETQRKDVSEKLFAAHAPGEKLPDGGAPPAAVFTSIVVRAKGDSTTLEKKGGDWWITAPVSARADRSAVEQLISHIETTKVKATVEENPSDADLAKYGLDKPRFTVTAYAYVPDANGEGANDPSRRREVDLYGGIENTFDGSIYLRRGTDKAVYTMDGSAKYSLERNTFDLREKEVLAVEEAKLKQIDFKAKSNRYLLERDENKSWQLKSPKPMAADNATVATMISNFRNDRAVAFLTDSPEERKRTGVGSPTSDVAFTAASGEKTRIRLAKTKIGDEEHAFALREGSDQAVLAEVPIAAVSALDKTPADLRDKSVLTFNREQVARVIFSPGSGPEIVVEKVTVDGGPSEDWRIAAPTSGPAKKWKLSSLLWSLSSLKATSVADEQPKDFAKYGISPSSEGVTLADQSGKVLAKLQLGNAVKGKPNSVYARGSRNAVLEVDSTKLAELPSKIDDVLEAPPQASDGGSLGVSSN
jgi:hypothetical protein